jgi:zinc resistance-associated protein
MIKEIAAGAVALTIAGASLALAQQAPPRAAPRWQPSAEDISAFTDARIAALRAGLKLSADQEKHWPAVEQAMRDLAQQRADRMKDVADRRAARREARRSNNALPAPDAIGRLRRGADVLSKRGAALKKLADVAEPLYKALDEGQKRRFWILLREGDQPGPWHWQRRADNTR